jgi:hypothetical protein
MCPLRPGSRGEPGWHLGGCDAASPDPQGATVVYATMEDERGGLPR